MKKTGWYFLVLLFFFVQISGVQASHMISAELGWTCVGNDSFIIRLNLYTDCNGSPPAGTSNVNFICATTGVAVSNLSLTLTSPVDITPVCQNSCTRCQNAGCSFPYGIKRYTMQGLVVLSGAGNCCNIKLTWNECCRNGAITTGASSANFYTEALLNRCQNPGSSSPQFTDDPIKILCVGQDFTWAAGSNSNSGTVHDSLTYEWAEPLSAANSAIPYVGSYAYNKPIYFWGFPNDALPFPRGIHLDPISGDMQFRPMKAEVTVMVFKVNVFRKNVKIAEVRREIQVIVITCTNNNPPTITTPNNVRSKSVCAGDSVGFTFSTIDPNSNDTLKISVNNIPPGAVWANNNGQVKHPSATLTWLTTKDDGNALPFTFYVTARDNACPIFGSNTQAFQISVKLKINGKVIVSDSGAGLFHFELDSVYKQNLVYTLNIGGTKHILDQSNNYQFDSPGVYLYTLNVSYPNACNTIFDTGTLTVDTFLYSRLPADTAICTGSSITIKPVVYANQGPVTYLWSTGDTTPVLLTGPISSNQIITLTVKDSINRPFKNSIKISMLKTPVMIPADTLICYGSTFRLEPNTSFAKGHITYDWRENWWITGDTNRILQTVRLFNNTGITLTVKDSTGCTATNEILINTMKNYSMIPDNLYACSGTSVNINPSIGFTKGHVKYIWSTGDTNKILHTGPLFKDSLITLTILDSTGCTIDDYTFITKLSNPEITMNDKVVICKSTTTSVTPYVQIFGTNNSISSSYWHKSGNYSGITFKSPLKTYDSGTFVYIVSDKFGCRDSDSVSVVYFPTIDTSLHVNGSTLTAASGMQKYVWYWNNDPVLTGIWNTFVANQIGWYFAQLTDYFDCVDSTRMVFINPAGIQNLALKSYFRLYPNPTTGKISLETGESITSDINLSVFNMLGKEILTKTIDFRLQKEVDISDQPKGIYTVIIRYQNTSFYQLIIKE